MYVYTYYIPNQSMMITVTSKMMQCLLTLVTLSILIIGTFGDGKFGFNQEFKHVPSSIQHGHNQERVLSDKSQVPKDSPLRGIVFINEVATTSTPSYELCPNIDWIELIITGENDVDISGFVLHDDQGPDSNEAFTFPPYGDVPPGVFFTFCKDGFGFPFDIDSNDTITLLDSNGDLIATTGVLPNGGGNATSTYQRTSSNTYMYGRPTPDKENFPMGPKDSPLRGIVYINEVASTSTPSYELCPSVDWIELLITGDNDVDISGFVLHDNQGPDSNEAFTFPRYGYVQPGVFLTFCKDGFGFPFDIDSNDIITLLDSNGDFITSTGVLPNGGGNATFTYQRTSNDTYMYGYLTPERKNFPTLMDSIFINEVARNPTLDYDICTNKEWIELLNTGNETINLKGLQLQVERGAANRHVLISFSGTLIRPGEFVTFCNDQADYDVDLDIGFYDTIILLDYYGNVLSSTGTLPATRNGRFTYQRTRNNTYEYGRPTPGLPNFPMISGSIYINEVATSPVIFFEGLDFQGYPWIEIINIGSDEISLQGFVLHDDNGRTSNDAYTFGQGYSIKPGVTIVIFNSIDFIFDIDNNDVITLLDYNGNVVSTTGFIPNGGNLTSTYQRTKNNTYMYGFPSPYIENFQTFTGSVLINEVSGPYFPGNKLCYNQPWVEIINTGSTNVDTLFLIINDDEKSLSNPNDDDGYFLSNSNLYINFRRTILAPGEISVLCIGGEDRRFAFFNSITLRDFNGNVISTTGILPDVNDFTLTYQRTRNNTFIYGPSSQNQENFAPYIGSILINEVASSFTRGYDKCSIKWIELINAGNKDVDVTGFVLHDDRGPSSSESFTFVDSVELNYFEDDLIIYPGEIKVLCGNFFNFDIDNNDRITLRDANGIVLSTTGILPNGESSISTYQRITGTNNTYMYGLPTPEKRNIVTAKVTAPISLPAFVPISSPIAPVPVKVAVPTPIAASIPTPVVHPILPLPLPVSVPSQQVPVPVKAPITVPLPTKQVAPVSVPLKAPTQQVSLPILVPTPTQQVPLPVSIVAPVSVPLKAPTQQVPLPVSIVAPVSVPLKAPTQQVPLPIVVPIPTQQVQLLPVLIDAPVLLPIKVPPQQIPLHNPDPIPTQQVPLPIPVSVKSPATPVQVPVVKPNMVPTTSNASKVPSTRPIEETPVPQDDCGLFGFSLICLFSNECGFLRRLFNIGDC